MRVRAAVLDRMGALPPYANTRPLRVATVDLDPPGRGEVPVDRLMSGTLTLDGINKRFDRLRQVIVLQTLAGRECCTAQ